MSGPLVSVLIADVLLGVTLVWMWASGWAQDDHRAYRKMQRTYKRKGR